MQFCFSETARFFEKIFPGPPLEELSVEIYIAEIVCVPTAVGAFLFGRGTDSNGSTRAEISLCAIFLPTQNSTRISLSPPCKAEDFML